MDGHLENGVVRLGGNARQQFHDSRGYGRPLSGNEIELSRVEAAHLLFRGDLDSVDGLDFRDFFVASTRARDRFGLRFLVYADLRERGFYLSPADNEWPGPADPDADFVVYPRGKTADDGVVEHRVRVVGERESVAAEALAGYVLAVVDEESELTYLDATTPDLPGGTDYDPPASLDGLLVDDRVLVWDAPADLYEHGFYGQPLAGRETDEPAAIQLSLVEAASLVADEVLRLSVAESGDTSEKPRDDTSEGPQDDYAAILARGRAVEGERFDRRLRVYRRLRGDGLVPKTGYKFGADFRTYAEVESVSNLSHSEHLVRVLPASHRFDPRELALDVRLAGGVRKQMVFALVDDGIEWLSVGRVTP
ncbi:tRNA-intron lyase [Salinirubrum litoreum]|uniref:tRNA-splicing endonuclease n=1 Tax=Salinirubrum litoreum TaxID=1126234 RepID=A0ABD5RDX5_9EURY|nr:tRNA-intron lyase [Salinirubrum litoreum]